MQFCDNCGSAMVKQDDDWICRSCNPDKIEEATTASEQPSETLSPRSAELSRLSTTDSGSVRKQDAIDWLNSLEPPSDKELKDAIVPKPYSHSGSTYPTSISNIRLTGDPQFIETVAALFQPLLDFEDNRTRVEINLQRTEDRDTGEVTGNYALYLSVAERA